MRIISSLTTQKQQQKYDTKISKIDDVVKAKYLPAKSAKNAKNEKTAKAAKPASKGKKAAEEAEAAFRAKERKLLAQLQQHDSKLSSKIEQKPLSLKDHLRAMMSVC